MTAALLDVREVSVKRGCVRVLKSASLRIAVSERVAIVGPNAAGKSTLLLAIAGHVPLETGTVLVGGRDASELSPVERARDVALVGTLSEGAPSLSVFDYVALGRYAHLGPFRPMGSRDRDVVRRSIETMGVTQLAQRSFRTLSAGEKQRVSIARGLAQEPRILLLDEPSAHLDIGHALDLFQTLENVSKDGVAVLVVLHDLAHAGNAATRIVALRDGHVVVDAPAQRAMLSEALGNAFGIDVQRGDPHGYAFRRRTMSPRAPG